MYCIDTIDTINTINRIRRIDMSVLKTGVRILTPAEYQSLDRVVAKPSLKVLLRALLFTGMRYQELIRLKQNPSGFHPDKGYILVKSGKREAVYSERYVHLTPAGVQAVKDFLADERMDYPSSAVMTKNLCAWARAAHLEAAPELEGGKISQGANAGLNRQNVWGMSVKSFRKSWESWLAVSFPDRLEMVMLSQGHQTATSIKHYLGVPFSQDEREEIRTMTAGWMA